MEKIYTEVKASFGECPVCNGTGKRPCPDNLRSYGVRNGWYGYVVDTDGKDYCDCTNCGSQYMFSKPTGLVSLRKDTGEPCVHEYTGSNAGRCYTKYVCKNCGDTHHIDSGD